MSTNFIDIYFWILSKISKSEKKRRKERERAKYENERTRNKRVTGAGGSAKLRAEAKEGGLPRHDVLLESH